MNELVLAAQLRVAVVVWHHVGHTYKVRKVGLVRGIFGEIRMIMNIIETVSLVGTAHQIIALLRIRKLYPVTTPANSKTSQLHGPTNTSVPFVGMRLAKKRDTQAPLS